MKRRKQKGRGPLAMPTTVVGYAWYKKDQWARLREVCPDGDDFEDNYEDWRAFAETRLRQLAEEIEPAGMRLVKVVVELDEFLDWCRANGCQPDGPGRSRYAAERAMTTRQGS